MKKILMLFAAVTISGVAMAQKTLAFPFQGGQGVMTQFFKDNFVASNDITRQNASGVVILKFTADLRGNIKKIIVYYAEDFSLAQPAADMLKKSDHKWIIPDGEKIRDFILTLNISYNEPLKNQAEAQVKFAKFYSQRSPIVTNNQIPLDTVTLLPVIELKYGVVQ